MRVTSTGTQLPQFPRRGFSLTMLATASLLSAAVTTNAYADERTAAANLTTNMARAGRSFNSGELMGRPTPVRGMYAIVDRTGETITYTNEAGTIMADPTSFTVLGPGRISRPMTPDEQKDMRAEFMANLDYSKLIKNVYGNGGGRKLLMFSALDCGYCKKLEDALARNARTLNTTFYVVPTSLQGISQGGLPTMQAVTNIWCAPNSGDAWRNFWSKRVVPQERSCRLTPQSAETEYDQIRSIFDRTGEARSGVPRVLNEEGIAIPASFDMNAASAAALYGPGARPGQAVQKAAYWIPSEAEAVVQMQALAAQAPVQQQQQQPGQQSGKINTKDLLKKLFN
jgi:hypothetical protein